MIRELVLGPVKLELAPIVPDGTEVNAVFVRDGICYIDFSREVLDLDEKLPFSLKDTEAFLMKNLSFNYGIDNVHITVEGQVPGHSYYRYGAGGNHGI